MYDRCKFFVNQDWSMDGFRIYVTVENAPKGQVSLLTQWTVETIDEFASPPEIAPLYMRREAAQHLLDQLIRAGLVPSDGVGSPAQVEAMKDHIKDLRRMAFDNQRNNG